MMVSIKSQERDMGTCARFVFWQGISDLDFRCELRRQGTSLYIKPWKVPHGPDTIIYSLSFIASVTALRYTIWRAKDLVDIHFRAPFQRQYGQVVTLAWLGR